MALTVEDLQPKDFVINVKGVELTCKPLKLWHALVVSKIGKVLEKPEDYTAEAIKQAEVDLSGIIADVIPKLKGVELGMNEMMEVVQQMMGSIAPEENKELEEKGVSFDTDPKG